MVISEKAKNGVWLLVDFYIRPDKIEVAEALFEQHVQDGRKDRGNLFFSMLRKTEEPGHFVSIECWESEADIENHDAQPHHPIFLRHLAVVQRRQKVVQRLDFFAEGLL